MRQKPMQWKAALFDLDGVVFDTEPQYTVFWGEICRQYHPEIPGLENRIKGQTLTQIFDAYFADNEAARRDVVSQLDQYEAGMSYDYIRGFVDFIQNLRCHGVATALVTSSNHAKMASVYRSRPELPRLFDIVLTSEDFSESKPSPDCYLKAAERFGAQRQQCIVFEDSFNGLRSGKSAGMAVVGLTTSNSRESISDLCDVAVSDFSEIVFDDCLEVLARHHAPCDD